MNAMEKQILDTVLKPCSEGGQAVRFPLDDGTPEGTHINLAGIIQAARQIGWREGIEAASSHVHPQGRLVSGAISNELCEQHDKLDQLAQLEPPELLAFMHGHWPAIKWVNSEWPLPDAAV